MRQHQPRRSSLGRNLAIGSALLSALAVGLFGAIMVSLTHQQVHRQADALLAQLATNEMTRIIREYSRGIHLHDSALVLSASQAEVARRYAVAVNERCEVLAANPPIADARLRGEWCKHLEPDTARSLDVYDVAPIPLRGSLVSKRAPDGQLVTVLVGIDDEVINSSTWQAFETALPMGLLIIFLFGGLAALLGVRLGGDLARLSAACQRLEEEGELADPRAAAENFTVSAQAPREIDALAQTMRDLITRLGGLLETQERFIAEAAHELRTPLTALQGELELALRRERSGDEYRQALTNALSDARRLIGLSELLLDATRAKTAPLEVEPASLPDLVEGCIGRTRRELASRGISLHAEANVPEAVVRAHTLSASRVIENLLENASRHGKPTNVWVRLERPADAPGFWDLWVEDDGVGIPEGLAEHLFAPFQRASQAHGHGLGLYLSRGLMNRQGGDVTLHRPQAPATGARFRVRFAADLGGTTPPKRGSGRRRLVE